MDQFWVQVTGRLKARDWYHVNPAKLHAPNNPSTKVKFYTTLTLDYIQLMSNNDLAWYFSKSCWGVHQD